MKKLVMAHANDYDSRECLPVISSHLGDAPTASGEAADRKTRKDTKADTIQVIICSLKISFLCLQPLRRVLKGGGGIHSDSQSDQAIAGMNSILWSRGKPRWR